MEEVDDIILQTLNNVGCEFDDVSSLRDMSTENVVEGCVRCLATIDTDVKLQPLLPPSMSARYRIATTLAQHIKDLGYKDELGYQTFLYANENDIRKVFIFLMDKLPTKDTIKIDGVALSEEKIIENKIKQGLERSLKMSWIPPYCRLNKLRPQCFRTTHLSILPENSNSDCLSEFVNHVPPLIDQGGEVYKACFYTSVLERNVLKIIKDEEILTSKKTEVDDFKDELITQEKKTEDENVKIEKSPKPPVKPQIAPKPTLSTRKKEEKDTQAITEQLQNELQKLDKKREETRSAIESTNSDISRIKSQCEELRANIPEDDIKVLRLSVDLLPNIDENLQKLKSRVENSKEKIVNLQKQWKDHNEPMMEKINSLETQFNSFNVVSTQLIEEMKLMRQSMKEMREEAKRKDEIHNSLLQKASKKSTGANRSAYTTRILEIVANIKKQSAEIDKILTDTRELQKEINKLQGQLERSFSLADELLFKDAKKDEVIRRSYKHLATLHESCETLISSIEETGNIRREICQLQDQVDNESEKKVNTNLQRLKDDYNQMKQENSILISKLKN